MNIFASPRIGRYLVLASLLALAPVVVAQTPADQGAVKLESIKEGELRLDGKVIGTMGAEVWQLQVASWTSPRGITTDFTDPKNKGIHLEPDVVIHTKGSDAPLTSKDVKLGDLVAVIGKNGPDGSLLAREVIVMRGSGTSVTGSSVTINKRAAELVEQGRAAHDGGQTSKALDYFNQALAAAQGALDTVGEGLVLRELGSLYSEMGQEDKAIASFNKSLQATKGRGSEEASAYNGLGISYLHTDKTAEAVKALEKAVDLSADSEPRIQALYLENLVLGYRKANQSDESFRTLQKLQPVQDLAGDKDDATATLASLALLSVKRSAEDARGYLGKATPRVGQVKDLKLRASIYVTLGRTLWYLSEKDQAKAQFDAAAKQYDAIGDTDDAKAAREMLGILAQAEPVTAPAPPPAAPDPGAAITPAN